MLGSKMLGPASLKLRYSQAVPANMRGNVREVTALHTPESQRNQGHASRLMQKTCAEADARQIVLVLTADTPALADWYARFGFDVLPGSALFMARAVNAPERFDRKPTAVC